MRAEQTALQLGRVALLVLLLRLMAGFVDPAGPVHMDRISGKWIGLSVVSLMFVLVALAGRERRHPRFVLAIEGVIAAVIAFVPPARWLDWFGHLHGWPTAMLGGFAQPLAVAWLAGVLLKGFHQARDGGPAPDGPDSPGPNSDAVAQRQRVGSA